MCKAQNISLILLEKCPIGLVFFVGIFNFIRVTLIIGLLQTTEQRKLRKTWVSKAQGHVSD